MKEESTKPYKYNEEQVTQFLRTMIIDLEDDNKADPVYIFKGQLFEKLRIPSKEWSYWLTKFKDNDQIMEAMARIDDMLQSRAVVGGVKGKYNASMTKFHLMNNFNWREKSSVDHSGEIETGNDALRSIASDMSKLVKNESTSQGSSQTAS